MSIDRMNIDRIEIADGVYLLVDETIKKNHEQIYALAKENQALRQRVEKLERVREAAMELSTIPHPIELSNLKKTLKESDV